MKINTLFLILLILTHSLSKIRFETTEHCPLLWVTGRIELGIGEAWLL